MEEIKIKISNLAIVVGLLVTTSCVLFMTKCSHENNEGRIEEDATYVEKRDSILNAIDSLRGKTDTLIVIRDRVRIKTDIRFISTVIHDTLKQLERDSSLVTEIYKRDTIINLANEIISTQRAEIKGYEYLDSTSNTRIKQLELKLVRDVQIHRQVVDSLDRRNKGNKIKFLGYGILIGAGVRSLLP
jgi:hypothetical protein